MNEYIGYLKHSYSSHLDILCFFKEISCSAEIFFYIIYVAIGNMHKEKKISFIYAALFCKRQSLVYFFIISITLMITIKILETICVFLPEIHVRVCNWVLCHTLRTLCAVNPFSFLTALLG